MAYGAYVIWLVITGYYCTIIIISLQENGNIINYIITTLIIYSIYHCDNFNSAVYPGQKT